MRIIFLNSWYGTAGKPYFDFIKKESSKTDIFCFMEVSPDLYSKLLLLLKDFNVIYEKGHLVGSPAIICGQAVFITKEMKIDENGKVSICHPSNKDVGIMQFAKLNIGERIIWLGSLHGKTLPGDKLDTPIRLKQSQKIIDFFEDKPGLKIIGGDFNLYPNTKSIKMFEEAGYRNLIRDFDIQETRNRLSWEQVKEQAKALGWKYFGKQHFADYCFTSPEVKINNFEVPNIEISDHLPLILDFSFDSA